MEKLTIKAPEGYEFSIKAPEGYEFSGFNENGEIEFVPIKKKYPLSVEDIEGRTWYLNGIGSVCDIAVGDIAAKDINNVSTKERAEAILALTQLLELRDAWNKIDGFAPDWKNYSQVKYCIVMEASKIKIDTFGKMNRVFSFGSFKTAEKFLAEFKSLIETAKELL